MRPSSDVLDFTVLDETEDWIVVSKAAPLQIHPSKPDGPPTLWHGLRKLLAYELATGGSLSIINRLDRETSGLTVVAKHKAAARVLHKAMARREAEKEYLALVTGWPEWESLRVEAPILRRGEVMASPIYLLQLVHDAGVPCLTHFRVVSRWERVIAGKLLRFATIAARPCTGRMHQIRVHLSHTGHGIVGDKLYGPDCQWYLRQIESGWTPAAAAALHMTRHALHSHRLSFGPGMEWTAPLPADMVEFASSSLRGPVPNSGTVFDRQTWWNSPAARCCTDS